MDYADRQVDLDQSDNPFAIVVKAHLAMQTTRKDPLLRKQGKLHLIRQLYEAGYNQKQIQNLFNFLDWILVLPQSLETAFWQEIKTYEEERKVAYITSVQRIGREEGRVEGMTDLICELIQEQLGDLPADLQAQIVQLESDQIKALGRSLLKFSQLSDLQDWLAAQG